MARLSTADERRALMRAAEWWERCRLICGGNRQRGYSRLAVAERCCALRMDDAAASGYQLLPVPYSTAAPSNATVRQLLPPRGLKLTPESHLAFLEIFTE